MSLLIFSTFNKLGVPHVKTKCSVQQKSSSSGLIMTQAKSMPTFSYTIPQFSSPQTPGRLRLQLNLALPARFSGCAKEEEITYREYLQCGSTSQSRENH